jgi:hypothetical protein
MSGSRRGPEVLLTLLAEGGANLTIGGKSTWASDSDEEFAEEFAGREMLDENDIGELLEYLVDTGTLSEDEADECEIDIETLDANEEADDADVIDVESERIS